MPLRFFGGYMYFIVGLGNPGREYAETFHNTGFRVIDILAQKHAISVERNKCKALIGEGCIGSRKIILCKPQTYMNLSGESIVQLLNWYKCEAEQILIVYDDIDLPLGKLRFRTNGSAGTHNGMRNIVALSGRNDFPRIRVGIGRPPEYMDLKDYVLSAGSNEDKPLIKEAIEKAAYTAEIFVTDGVDAVRNYLGM